MSPRYKIDVLSLLRRLIEACFLEASNLGNTSNAGCLRFNRDASLKSQSCHGSQKREQWLLRTQSHLPKRNLGNSGDEVDLVALNSKQLYYRGSGVSTAQPIIFIHGLEGSSESFTPLIAALGLEETHSLHLLDLEGQGLSPIYATSIVSISSYASDVYALTQHAAINGAIIIAHSMGCLVVVTLAVKHPDIVTKLILLGPTPSPLSAVDRDGRIERAETVRSSGMLSVADSSAQTRVSSRTKIDNLPAIDAVRGTLLGQDPEGYAKGCEVLARETKALPLCQIKAETLIVTGDEDVVSSPAVCQNYATEILGSRVEILQHVGHWHIFEDLEGVSNAVGPFL